MNPEIMAVIVLSPALVVGLLFYFQAYKHKNEKIVSLLITETKEALRDNVSKIQGLSDHITRLDLEYKALQNENAEFTAAIDPDQVAKLQDRIAIVEMTVGVRRIDQVRKVASEKL